MSIFLVNRSKHAVKYSIDNGNFFWLAPGEKVALTCSDFGKMKLSVKHNYESSFEKNWRKAAYQLVLASEYNFDRLTDGAEIFISREKIRFSLNACYDRFFAACSNAVLLSENHSVAGAEQIIKKYQQERKRDTTWEYLLELIFSAPAALIFMVIIRFSLSVNGLTFPLYYFLIGFVLFNVFIIALISLARLAWKLAQKMIKNMNNKKTPNKFLEALAFDERKEFLEYFQNDFILRYYSSKERIPYSGECET